MKLVNWNCAGAFRKKYRALDQFDADVLVIQECEDPAHSSQAYRDWAGNYAWVGATRHKGLGVFARRGHRIKSLDWAGEFSVPVFAGHKVEQTWRTEDLQSFLPVRINDDITLLAVWTKRAGSDTFNYIGQLWKYLTIHLPDLPEQKGVAVGDFNSNVIWDRADRWWNHSDVVHILDQRGYRSAYHHVTGEEPGAESHPTYYMYRHPDKGYHIDYSFLTTDLLAQAQYQACAPQEWLQVSDHIPQIIQF
ncbi:endonuclease/exonuclease/phosphatase family protein [Gilvimarinus xylanilyticus]|uniref:Endonuclease/exonuclease/phosphatase family protein n=1 Tax=Gilvimarinus xylanilyticus TaxID=2944139 RepID=A0A9X2HSR2_9GAMM|nr:endonuclease/exonuclease/phosphatase family protein [Gilvimarinus xylanilyticus]MCP8897858.1 endonuclease/exonuclease/phosphatase family protein [Gilvimarinus xylanilyticus]